MTGVIARLRTTDLAGSIRFYTTQVGLKLEFQYRNLYAGIRAGRQVFHLKRVDEKDPSIEIVDHGEHFHLCFEPDDAAVMVKMLKKKRGAAGERRARHALVHEGIRDPRRPGAYCLFRSKAAGEGRFVNSCAEKFG